MRTFILSLLFLFWSMTPADAQMIVHSTPSFTSLYDLSLQCPRQVEWTVQRKDIGSSKREPGWLFFNDLHVEGALARHSDFTRSGYDRGHMCPAADRNNDTGAMRSTFSLANVAPQSPALNRGAWKSTEDSCRNLVMIYDSIRVVSIPIFLLGDTIHIGRHHLAVPHAFVKAAWTPANDSIVGLWWFWNR